MADPWPSDLPQCFIFSSLREVIGDTRLRSQPDAGPAQVRPRSTAAPGLLAGSMKMTEAQWQSLKTFGSVTLLSWTLPFLFPSPTGGDLVRFGESLPTRRRLGAGTYVVDFVFEVLP